MKDEFEEIANKIAMSLVNRGYLNDFTSASVDIASELRTLYLAGLLKALEWSLVIIETKMCGESACCHCDILHSSAIRQEINKVKVKP